MSDNMTPKEHCDQFLSMGYTLLEARKLAQTFILAGDRCQWYLDKAKEIAPPSDILPCLKAAGFSKLRISYCYALTLDGSVRA